jgi:hypothetical protein
VKTEPLALTGVGLGENVRFGAPLVESCDGPLHVHRHAAQVLAGRTGDAAAPGTFEHALHHLREHTIDPTPFDARYQNDATGALAYPPGMLLRVVLFADSRGLVSSRAAAGACEEQVPFIALSGDSRPHFTTIAHFVRTLGDQIAPIVATMLAVCDRQGLIGREMSPSTV